MQEPSASLEEKQKGLPEQIKQKKYDCERDLLNDRDEFGLGDCHIIRDKDGYAVWREMPGDEHNTVVMLIVKLFSVWKDEQSRTRERDLLVIRAWPGQNVYVSRSYSQNAKRLPNLGLWGPSRLKANGIVRVQDRKPMSPHVVIQVRMTTSLDSERAAMFDMMTFAGQDEYHALGRPRMGYLIDVLWTESPLCSPVYGFDVYEVAPRDPPPEDQPLVLPGLDAPIQQYRVGGNEDGAITIAAEYLALVLALYLTITSLPPSDDAESVMCHLLPFRDTVLVGAFEANGKRLSLQPVRPNALYLGITLIKDIVEFILKPCRRWNTSYYRGLIVASYYIVFEELPI
eukprot:scaffold269_cov125-Cylindrotheca_fusiformis.AAC.7